MEMQKILEVSTQEGVQTISSEEVCKKVLGSRLALVWDPKYIASPTNDVSSAHDKEERIKTIDELTNVKEKYAKMVEQNEKLISQLSKWEDRWSNVQKLLVQGHGGEGPSNTRYFLELKFKILLWLSCNYVIAPEMCYPT